MSDNEVTFADMGLPDVILTRLETLSYSTPTPIQQAGIPPLLEGHDVVGQAQTGTGKTAAFALPLLTKIDLKARHPQLLVLAPTRELASQVCEAVRSYGRSMKGLTVLPVYGGQGMGIQLKELRRGVHCVVGTPGRIIDHLNRGTLKLDNLRAVVLDEADEMLRMGFFEEVEKIMEATPEGRQTALFSATMPSQIRRIAKRFLSKPVEIKFKTKITTVETTTQQTFFVSGHAKIKALDRYLEVEDFDGMIVFVRTKIATLGIADKLKSLGYAAEALNGDMSQPIRESTVGRFKSGRFDILVCTDVAARGLDVARVSHVINFDIPLDTESYVHRIGRTGRAGREGKAILFAGRREMRLLKNIERATRKKIERVMVPTAKEVGEHRVAAFKKLVEETIEGVDLSRYESLLQDSFPDEATRDKMAAAILYLSQRERPFFVKDETLEDREPHQRQRSDRRDSRQGPPERMQAYRVEVGKAHGLEPRHLVGAIANEAGISGRSIGGIRIHDTHATIELPPRMPPDLLKHLQKVNVCGEDLKIKPLKDASRRPPPKGPKKPRPAAGSGPPFPKPKKSKIKNKKPKAKRLKPKTRKSKGAPRAK